jgi:putative phosphoribosyl transferase
MTFFDRREAGRALGRALVGYRGEHPLILALPRGGVPVGVEVARALGAPLDVLVVRKLGAPFQRELGIGAIAEGGATWINEPLCEELSLDEETIEEVAERERREVERRVRRYRGGRALPSVTGRTVILVDDGLATGGTARAAVRALRQLGAGTIVLAVPVGPPSTVAELRAEADEVVCLETPEPFAAIGLWYEVFDQVSDEEVIAMLARPPSETKTEAEAAAVAVEGSMAESVTEVSIPVDGGAISGTLVVPAGARGVVLFAHGSGSSRFSVRNRFVAGELRAAGLATLLMDLLTPEEEAIDRITAELRFDIDLLAERVQAATTWLAHAAATARLRVGYFGSSTGAAAALIAAAAQPGAVGAVVSRGGRPDLAGDALERVRAPTLLIVGGDDEVVLELNREALARMTCERALRVIPGATHLFEEPGALEEVARLARDWLRDHLAPVEEEARA